MIKKGVHGKKWNDETDESYKNTLSLTTSVELSQSCYKKTVGDTLLSWTTNWTGQVLGYNVSPFVKSNSVLRDASLSYSEVCWYDDVLGLDIWIRRVRDLLRWIFSGPQQNCIYDAMWAPVSQWMLDVRLTLAIHAYMSLWIYCCSCR